METHLKWYIGSLERKLHVKFEIALKLIWTKEIANYIYIYIYIYPSLASYEYGYVLGIVIKGLGLSWAKPRSW